MPKDVIEMVIKVKDQASKGLKGIGKEVSDLNDDLVSGAEGADGMGISFLGMNAASLTAAGGLAAVGSAAVAATTGVFMLAKGASDYVDRIQFAANETTLSRDTIVALESAMGGAGVEFGRATEALKGLSARMKEANTNGGPAAEKFSNLGIALKDAAGESRDADAVFRDAIDAIRLIPNEADRAAASMNIFGESGSRLLPVIEGGTRALDEWGAAAVAAGKGIDEEALQASEEFDIAMQHFTNATEGAAISLGTDLLPAVTKLVTVGAGMVSWLADTARWLGEVNPGFQLLAKLVDAATADTGAGVEFSAEDERMQEIARKRLQFEGGETVGEREAAARAPAAPAPAKKRARATKAAKTEDPFAGVNAFNELVDQLFGEQVLADAAKMAEADKLAADNLALFNAMIDEGIEAQSEARVSAELLAKAEADAAKAANEKALADMKAARGEAFSVTGGGLESTLSGGFTGILTALGPQGAMVGSVLSLLTNLEPIIQGLIDNVDEIIVALVESLPTVLFELIPALVQSLLTELPLAIADALFEVLDRLLGGKIKEAREGATAGLAESGIPPEILNSIPGLGLALGVKSFATGGFVAKSGLAMVHKGEEITPQNGVRSSGQQQRMGGGGGGNTININLTGFMDASSIDRFVQQLNRSIGSRGFGIASVN